MDSDRGGLRLKRRHNFLGKSICQMKRVLAEELLTEHYASRDGLLQRMDPRIKLITAVSINNCDRTYQEYSRTIGTVGLYPPAHAAVEIAVVGSAKTYLGIYSPA